MKRSSIYGAVTVLFVAVIIIAGVVAFNGNETSTQHDVQADSNEENMDEYTEVALNNTPPLYTESNVQSNALENGNEQVESTLQKPEEISDKEQENLNQDSQKDVFLESTDSTQTAVFDNEDIIFKYPAQGEIVMDYSIDKAIFDVTLEQYRTNDSIAISVPKGSDVLASADGEVSKIFEDSECGMTVVINHNDGWQTTYSQLEGDIAVSEGETVKSGQKIGSVANPTSYSVLLGSHIDFKLTHNGETVDPKTVLVR